MRFSFRRKAQVRTNILFIFIKSVPNAKETPKERICVVPTHRKPKLYKSGHSLVPLSAHILSYGFSMPCKRQALIFSLPSHPHQARFYRCALFFEFGSFIWLCLTSFTAAPLICNLQLTYRVSAVCFAWLCNVIPLICRQAQKLHTQKTPEHFTTKCSGVFVLSSSLTAQRSPRPQQERPWEALQLLRRSVRACW